MENKYRKNIAFFHHVKNAINKTVLLKCKESNKSAYYIHTNKLWQFTAACLGHFNVF